MTTIHALANVYFSFLIAAYAFALVVFDNGGYLQLLYVIGGALTVSYFVYLVIGKMNMHFPKPLLAYAALVALAAASIFWSEYQEYSIGKTLTMALILLNMYIIYNVVVHFKNITWLFFGLYIAAIVNLLLALGFIQLDLGEFQRDDSFRFGGTVNQPNLLGYITHISVFLAYLQMLSVPAKRKKPIFKITELFLLILISGVLVFLTFLTGSRTAIVLLVILLVWIVVSSINKPILIVPIFLLAVAAALFSGKINTSNLVLGNDFDLTNIVESVLDRFESGVADDDDSREARENLAKDAYLLYKSKPLFGHGIGAFEAEHGEYSHNNYLEVLSSVGVIGMILMGLIYLLVAFEAIKLRSFRLKIHFLLAVASLLLYDIALVSYTAKFQMLAPMLFVACIVILRGNNELSICMASSIDATKRTRRRRKKRR